MLAQACLILPILSSVSSSRRPHAANAFSNVALIGLASARDQRSSLLILAQHVLSHLHAMTDPALGLADLTSSFVRSAPSAPSDLVSPCAFSARMFPGPRSSTVVFPPGLTGVGSLFRYLHMLVWDF
ncbi:hypothetical protein BDP55DRAFT_355886 [Colletotrichum godetiae]|uniref:Secreted protein n=1 Tax=Colletotrichum godetiae TaxID=1209918 RepID=A0AAJ0AAA6_9PEZI|nr:uncharacterized protein BDP55DRAFT_355886 [Colletotrichum godetiae]KAK1659439.1 hypothetical protein BDP55DRAFT_355886 [Colletotrichum godetiae]